jgi:hypothetical protein
MGSQEAPPHLWGTFSVDYGSSDQVAVLQSGRQVRRDGGWVIYAHGRGGIFAVHVLNNFPCLQA